MERIGTRISIQKDGDGTQHLQISYRRYPGVDPKILMNTPLHEVLQPAYSNSEGNGPLMLNINDANSLSATAWVDRITGSSGETMRSVSEAARRFSTDHPELLNMLRIIDEEAQARLGENLPYRRSS